MAQKGSNNWLWWTIGSVSLLGVGVGAFLYFRKKKKDKELAAATNQPVPNQPVLQTIIQSAQEATGNKPTPFKNQAEGDKFRGWVNDKYPDYARQIDLDRTGAIDNSYIRKAFDKYGAEYLASPEGKGQVTLIAADGYMKIAEQMSDGNLKSESIADNKMRFYVIDRWGWNDIMANFTPDGGFWIEDEADSSKKFDGRWGYNNGIYTLKLNDGSFDMSDNEISEMVKQIARMKFPASASELNFSGFEGADGLDNILRKRKKKYNDSQDAML
jgi:hypothetical protein